jgi:hypothetical protein
MHFFTKLLTALGLAFVLLCVGACTGQEPAKEFLSNLPAGIVLEKQIDLTAAQSKAIGDKLGGPILSLSNAFLRIHGRPIQVNLIVARNPADAKTILESLRKLKPYPFCLQKGAMVFEYVGKNIDEALAIKTSYELGLIEKPKSVRYRVTADLGTIDQADAMACNLLFNHFLELQAGVSQDGTKKVQELSKGFTFGNQLRLRNPELAPTKTQYNFRPTASETDSNECSVTYSFVDPMLRENIPFVVASLEIVVDSTGFHADKQRPMETLTAPTKYWPSNDPNLTLLAERITEGKTSNEGKVQAILEWLSPGINLKYSGQTGSRWGTRKVLEQGFGHCWDFSDCFITLARAAGVPARQVGGWSYGTSGHIWAEYYREDQGWQQVDPTGGGKLACGIYHIPYFTSEDGQMPILYLSLPKIEVLE